MKKNLFIVFLFTIILLINEGSWSQSTGYDYLDKGKGSFKREDFETSIVYCTAALEIFKFKRNFPGVVLSLHELGTSYQYNLQIQLADSCYTQAIEIGIKNKIRLDILADLYNSYGRFHYNVGNYLKAKKHFNFAVKCSQEIQNNSSKKIWDSYTNLANSSFQLNEIDSACLNYQKAYNFSLERVLREEQRSSLINLAKCEIKEGNANKSIYLLNTANNIRELRGADVQLLGLAYKRIGIYEKATSYLLKSIQQLSNSLKSPHDSLTLGYMHLGDLYFELGEFENAKKYYQFGLKSQSFRITGGKPQIFINQLAIKCLFKNIQTLSELIKEKFNTQDFSNFIECIGQYFRKVDRFRIIDPRWESWSNRRSDLFENYNTLLKMLFEIEEKRFDRDLDDIIFKTIEKAKYFKMYNVFKRFYLKDELTPKSIKFIYTSKVWNAYKSYLLSNAIKNTEEQKSMYRSFYKEYRKVVSRSETIDIELVASDCSVRLNEIRSNIDHETIVLSYYTTDNNIYTQCIANEMVINWSSSLPSVFKNDIKELITEIQKYNFNRFDEKVKQVSRVLLPDLTNFLETKTKMVIIGDKLLRYFPFEVLKINHPVNGLKYLIEEFSIEYFNSLNMFSAFSTLQHSPEYDYEIICITPLQDELEYTSDEKFNIEKYFKGKSSVFCQNPKLCSEYFSYRASLSSRIFHLATHTQIDVSNNNTTGLKLSDEWLIDNDYFDWPKSIDLLVTSSCSIVKGIPGTGNQFNNFNALFELFAVSNHIFSVWDVFDEPTSIFMDYFYKFLMEYEVEYSKALQLAKIQMIRETKYKSPGFWGGFILLRGPGSI